MKVGSDVRQWIVKLGRNDLHPCDEGDKRMKLEGRSVLNDLGLDEM
jgi:hypothetical protein